MMEVDVEPGMDVGEMGLAWCHITCAESPRLTSYPIRRYDGRLMNGQVQPIAIPILASNPTSTCSINLISIQEDRLKWHSILMTGRIRAIASSILASN
jgi:hypothetical protein